MRSLALIGLCLGPVLACDPHVVDAVREPPDPIPTPAGGSGGAGGAPNDEPPLASALIHRYSFDGDGTLVLDTRGAAHGTVVGTTLDGTGQLTLAGARSAQYVDLPNNIVSGLTSTTIEVWLTWDGGSPWQRIFDFGSNNAGEDLQGPSGRSYLFLTADAAADSTRQLPRGMRLAYSQNGVGEEDVCNAVDALPSGTPAHVAAVIDAAAGTMALYQDGGLLVECELTQPLSAIADVNDWLGRSNYQADADFAGKFDELRIYDAPLSAAELAESFAAGPDVEP
jgi:hypothetical protein